MLSNSKATSLLVIALLAPLYYGGLTLHHAFGSPYRIQDDMRQHVVWLRAAADPGLFRDDPVATYFRGVSPKAFRALFEGAATAGLDPVSLAKTLPLPLAMATTLLAFAAARRIYGPAAAAVTSVALNQSMWSYDDLASGTPRAFVWVFLAAVTYLLARRAWVAAGMTAGAVALFYPVAAPVATVFVAVHGGRAIARSMSVRMTPRSLGFGLILLVALGLLAAAAVPVVPRGDLFTADDLARLPEFGRDGRIAAWRDQPAFSFWLTGPGGVHPRIFGVLALLGAFYPFTRPRWPEGPGRALPYDLALASLLMFGAAHVSFPLLYYPDRHTKFALAFALCLAAGPVALVAWERGSAAVMGLCNRRVRETARVAVVAVVVAAIALPAVPNLFLRRQYWIDGRATEIYDALARMPKDTLVASLSEDASNIPAFSNRSIFSSREFMVTFHRSPLMLLHARSRTMLEAHYTLDATVLKSFVDLNGIDYFLLVQDTFTEPFVRRLGWATATTERGSGAYSAILEMLERAGRPALARGSQHCTAVTSGPFVLVDAPCAAAHHPGQE